MNRTRKNSDVQKSSKKITPEKTSTKKSKDDEMHEIPDELQNLVNEAPPAVKRSFMAMLQTQSRQVGGHPLYEKFTPEHIDKFLDYCHKGDEYSYKITSSNRWFSLAYTALAIGFLIFLIIYLLPANVDILTEILKILISVAGGFGIGYGWKSSKEKKK